MTLDEIERSARGRPIAERNVAIGLWAGRIIGFKGRELSAYVLDVMRADLHIPGPDDMINKISYDFIVHGVELESNDIAHQVERQERLARISETVAD